MRRARKLFVGLFAMIMATVLVSCGGSQGEEDVTLRFANVYDASHPFNECGFGTVSDEVESASEGGLALNNFPGAQLGAEDELAESVTGGNLEMAIIGPSFLAQYDDRVGVLDAAYLFEGVEHMEEVVDGEIGQELWDGLLEESNMRVLGTWYYGTRQFTTGDTKVLTPEDLEGLQIRAADVPIPIANIRAMGGSPAPIALEEVYLALEQGTADGQENPISTIASQNFNEVQDYLMLTNHVVQSTQIVVSEQTWQTLSKEQRGTLQEAIDTATPEVRDCIESEEEQFLSEWDESGSPQIIEDVDVEAFRDKAQDRLPEQFGNEWGNDLYRRIQEAAE